MPQPPEVEAFHVALLRMYGDAWETLLDLEQQVARAWVTRSPRRRALAAELRAFVGRVTAELDAAARGYAVDGVPQVYALGARDAVAARDVLGVDVSWSTADAAAIQRLAEDVYGDLLAATRYVRRDTKRFLRAVTRRKVGETVLLGQTAQAAARDAADLVAEQGIHAVRYSNGARHGLADYVDMVVRTKSAQAYNTGTLNRLGDAGVGWCEVFDGPGCGWVGHADADKANGTVRALADCLANLLSHPRCQRSFSGRVDVQNAEQARSAEPTTPEAQRVDAAAVERAREAASRRRAARARRRRSRAARSR